MIQALEQPPASDIAHVCKEIEDRINHKKLKLPVLPEAIQKVLAMKSDPEFSIAELSRLIHKDHTLAGHVLKVGNSSVYAGAFKTHSLSQAISRLGGQALVKIAVSITMQGEVFKVVGFKDEIRKIWHHSLASGVYAQRISELSGSPDPEMYMCGLMHQVGKPVLLQTLSEIIRTSRGKMSDEQVGRILDRYHTIVGFQLADGWKLPDSVTYSCLHYENPSQAESEDKAVNMTHLASRLADIIMDLSSGNLESIYDDPVLEAIGITKQDIDILLGEKKEVVEMMHSLTV